MLKDCLCCHIYCAHFCAPWLRTVTASRAVSKHTHCRLCTYPVPSGVRYPRPKSSIGPKEEPLPWDYALSISCAHLVTLWQRTVTASRAVCTARSVEDETQNAELNGNRNPEWWGDFSQLVKIEKTEFLGISRYKVELRF